MEVIKYGNFSLDKEIIMFVNSQLSIGNHNKSYDYGNNIKKRQKPKILLEKCNEVSKPFKP